MRAVRGQKTGGSPTNATHRCPLVPSHPAAEKFDQFLARLVGGVSREAARTWWSTRRRDFVAVGAVLLVEGEPLGELGREAFGGDGHRQLLEVDGRLRSCRRWRGRRRGRRARSSCLGVKAWLRFRRRRRLAADRGICRRGKSLRARPGCDRRRRSWRSARARAGSRRSRDCSRRARRRRCRDG